MSDPVSELEFGGHARHEAWEGAAALGENVVTGQRVQELDCVRAHEPGEHIWQVRRSVAPTTGEAVPAGHSWHTVLEVSA